MKRKYEAPEFDLLIIKDDIIVQSGGTSKEDGFETETDGSVNLPFIPFG